MLNVVYTPDLNGSFSYLFHLTNGGLRQTSTWITTAAAMVAFGYGIRKAIPWVKTQIENRTMLDICVAAYHVLFMPALRKKSFEETISILNRINPDLVKENRDALFANRNYVWSIISGFEALCRADRTFGTQTNLEKLIENKRYAHLIGDSFEKLYRAAPNYVTQDHLDQLMKNGDQAPNIAFGFIVLCRAAPHLAIEANLNRLIESVADIGQTYRSFESLPVRFRTQENLNKLIATTNDGPRIISMFQTMHSLRQGFATQANLDSMIANARKEKAICWTNVMPLCRAFERLQRLGFGTQPNMDQLIANAENAEAIAEAFERLPVAFRTQPVLDGLIATGNKAQNAVDEFLKMTGLGFGRQSVLESLIFQYSRA